MKKLLGVCLAGLAVTACGGTASVSTTQPAASVAVTVSPTSQPSTSKSTPIPVVNVTPEPTPEPTDPPTGTYKPGETATVTANGEDYLDITVSKVKFVPYYSGDYGYKDTPDQKGYVFVQAYVQYVAKTSGASYNQFDWTPYAGDEALDDFASAIYGPKPDLGSGDLPKGRKASGWVIYEVPKTGRITLAYQPAQFTNDEPVFEFVLRSK